MTAEDKSDKNGNQCGEADVLSEPTAEGVARAVKKYGGTEQDQGKGEILYLILPEH